MTRVRDVDPFSSRARSVIAKRWFRRTENGNRHINHAEINRSNRLRMVAQECPPALGWRSSAWTPSARRPRTQASEVHHGCAGGPQRVFRVHSSDARCPSQLAGLSAQPSMEELALSGGQSHVYTQSAKKSCDLDGVGDFEVRRSRAEHLVKSDFHLPLWPIISAGS